MTVSQKQIQNAENTGAQGGNVNTTGMSTTNKQQIDAAVARGKGK